MINERFVGDVNGREYLEQSILHECLTDYNRCLETVNTLTPDDFHYPKNKIIFRYIKKLVSLNTVPDIVTIIEMAENGNDKVCDLFDYLDTIQGLYILNAHNDFTNYIQRLKEYSNCEKLRTVLSGGIDAIDNGSDFITVRSEVQKLFDSVDYKNSNNFSSIYDCQKESINELKDNINAKEQGISITAKSGLPTLDRYTGGFRKGQVIVLGANTGIGKTSLAYKISCETAKYGTVYYISREMTQVEMAFRDMALNSDFDMLKITSLDLSNDDIERMQKHIEDNKCRKLFIDDRTSSLDNIYSNAMSIKSRYGLNLVVIDYLQLLDRGKSNNEVMAIDNITRGIKTMAMNLKVPVLVLSQLNNKADIDEPDVFNPDEPYIPNLSDLRGSGSISQNADIVLFLCRNRNSNKGKLVMPKHRNGITGSINLVFNGKKTEYTELDIKHI